MDSPQEADTYEVKLRDGDVVVAYVRKFSSLLRQRLRSLTILFYDDRRMAFPTTSSTMSYFRRGLWCGDSLYQRPNKFNCWRTNSFSMLGFAWSTDIVLVHLRYVNEALCACMALIKWSVNAKRSGTFFRGGVSKQTKNSNCPILITFFQQIENRRVRYSSFSINLAPSSLTQSSVTVVTALIQENP